MRVPSARPPGPSQGPWSSVYGEARTLSRELGVSLWLLLRWENADPGLPWLQGKSEIFM